MTTPGLENAQEPRAVSQSQVTLARVMEVMDANNLGNVHGGVILRAVDTTGGTCAARHCGGPAVTAFMDEMAFLEPVRLSDILITKASVNWTGNTSLEVGVRVEVQRRGSSAHIHVGSAYLVFVSIDEAGQPTPVCPVLAETTDEQRRFREAQLRRDSRMNLRRRIEQLRSEESN